MNTCPLKEDVELENLFGLILSNIPKILFIFPKKSDAFIAD